MKTIQTKEISLCYQAFGEQQHPCVLLLGGLGTAMTRWTTSFCTQLAQRGFYVIRYDHRDTGCSSFTNHALTDVAEVMQILSKGKIETPFYSLYDLAADAIALLDQLQIRKAHIMGRSMGGIVGQIIASTYNERTLSLTVIMSTSLHPSLPPTAPDVMLQMMAPLPSYQEDKNEHLSKRLAFIKRISSTDLPFPEQEEMDLIEEDYQRNKMPNKLLMHIIAIGFTPYTPEITKQISCPTLLIHGTIDPIFPQAHALDLHTSIAHSKLLLIDNMGHDLHAERYSKIMDAFEENIQTKHT